jgi:solute carrier family 13 (sodium-dependent dicarboxylate transporter), member 2/3/5
MTTLEAPLALRPSDLQTPPAPGPAATAGARATAPGLSARAVIAAACMAALVAWLMLDGPDWPTQARITVGVFAMALIAWVVMRWDETPVALFAGLALMGMGVVTPEKFFDSLGHELIWLLAGAFILAAAWQHSGLAQRMALTALARVRNTQQLFDRLCWIIVGTAFVVPSTSGRAALLLPVFLVLAQTIRQPRIVRALALLFPTVILLSACVSLLGAGAHLVAVGFIERLGGPRLGFIDWVLLAAPFGVISSWFATRLIGWIFLTHNERRCVLQSPPPDRNPMQATQRAVVWITAASLVAFATSGIHGVPAALVALAAAVAVTCKPLTGLDMKSALKKVEWNLLLFLAATLVLGESLLETGAAERMAELIVAAMPIEQLGFEGVLGVVVLIALLSHLVITSRTARALVLIPTVAVPMAALGIETSEGRWLDPALLVLICTIGSGFCQTLAVSAKPVTLFAKTDVPTYSDRDLFVLSLWLLVPMAALLMGFALWVWPLQGLG